MKKRALCLLLAAVLVYAMLPAASAADQAAEDVNVVLIYEGGISEANHFSEGLAMVRLMPERDAGAYAERKVYIDKTGKIVLGPYRAAKTFSEGLAVVAIGDYPDFKYGFINKQGETVIPFEYDYAYSFSEGLAVVGVYADEERHNLQHGVIDKTGKAIVPIGKYKYIDSFSEGFAIVCDAQYKRGVIDRNGREVVPCKDWVLHDFHDGWSRAWKTKTDEVGYVSKNGEEMLFGKYDVVNDFSEGMAVVGVEDPKTSQVKYGYIDTTGREVTPCKYDDADDFSEGLASVGIGNGYQFIDKTGKVVLSGSNASAGSFHEGLAAMGIRKKTALGDFKWGYIDKTGKTVIPCEYGEVKDFHEGFAVVSRNTGIWYGLIDKSGREIMPCEGIYNGLVGLREGGSYADGSSRDAQILVSDGCLRSWDGHTATYYRIDTMETAYPSTQTVDLNGRQIEFQCYALKEGNGLTNYVKLRDVADALNGSAAQFEVGYYGAVNIATGWAYTPNGSENSTPFSGARECLPTVQKVNIDGTLTNLEAFTLTDNNGGGYTYYKLRDLGNAIGFKVDWTAEKGIIIETK